MSQEAEEGHQREEESNTAQATALSAASDYDLRVPCYCEENVWRLAYRKLNAQSATAAKQYYAVFVSNPSKCVCFFHQRANDDPLTPVFWDYHVLLLEQDTSTNQTLVLDIDSYLKYPSPLSNYLDQAFPADTVVDNPTHQRRQLDRVAPWFRVVPAQVYLNHFCSDRSHMWDKVRQKWLATPPTYNCIFCGDDKTAKTTSSAKSNLMTYVDMKSNLDDPKYGCVLTRKQLRERFL